MLPPTTDSLDLHCKRANYQARIWLQADQEQIIVPPPTDTFAWTKETSMSSPVWTKLPPIPEACLQLVTCGCKSKCKTVRCTCYKKGLRCTLACGCDASRMLQPCWTVIAINQNVSFISVFGLHFLQLNWSAVHVYDVKKIKLRICMQIHLPYMCSASNQIKF